MNFLKTGHFFGQTNDILQFSGLTLTDTQYTHEYVDWHYHENAYFTFILGGHVVEKNTKETYHCSTGTLLYHHWDEKHCNVKPKGFTRGFHIEISKEWFDRYTINTSALQGSIQLQHPRLKTIMYRILKEMKLDDADSGTAVDIMLTELFVAATNDLGAETNKKPLWVYKLQNLLYDSPPDHHWTLTGLSQQLDIHPVHLSRGFAKYFGCGFGEYLRILKIQKAMALLPDSNLSLTEISLNCGFADQSHFIRTFKALYHIAPMSYRKLLNKVRDVNFVLFLIK